MAQMVKHPPAMWVTWVWSLGWEYLLEKGMATIHSSILAWRIPQTEESGRLKSMGSQRVRHDWETFTFTFIPSLLGPTLLAPLNHRFFFFSAASHSPLATVSDATLLHFCLPLTLPIAHFLNQNGVSVLRESAYNVTTWWFYFKVNYSFSDCGSPGLWCRLEQEHLSTEASGCG